MGHLPSPAWMPKKIMTYKSLGWPLVILSGKLRTRPPLTELSRALRARDAEKVSKMSPGASGPRTPKSRQKVPGTVRKDPGRYFRDFFGISGPKGPRDLCKGRARSQRESLMGALKWGLRVLVLKCPRFSKLRSTPTTWSGTSANNLGRTPKGAYGNTQRSEKGSEKVLGRVLGKGFSEGF